MTGGVICSMSEADDLILFLSFFITWTARYKSSGNCEGRVPWRQLPVLFNIRTRKNSKLTTQCSGHSSSIFAISISSVALQKQKTIDHCVRDVLSDIASLSKRYFRFSKSFTDIKQSPTSRISPRAHYHWRQHLLKVLQRYVSMLLAVTKSPLQKCPPCPEFAINEMLGHLLRNSAGHTCIAYILQV